MVLPVREKRLWAGWLQKNREQHEDWMRQLTCPVLRLDGGRSLETNTKIIVDTYQKIDQ